MGLAQETFPWELVGTIVRRRCFGKNLAFADILSSADGETWKIAFVKDKMETGKFPTKNSALPFGGRVNATIFLYEGDWLVKSWSLTSDPRSEAIERATLEGGGISSSEYARSRHNACSNLLEKNFDSGANEFSNGTPRLQGAQQQVQSESHKPSNGKAYKVFAVWVKENLLSRDNDAHNFVLDVAGGKGRLSIELAVLSGVKCTVIDPVQRKPPKVKHLIKQGRPVPDFITSYFASSNHDGLPTGSDWVQSSIPHIKSHTCLVGLHPDQCTEDIVDAALRHGKPFAVVPCCVYPDLFSKRKLKSGKLVRTYEDFVLYLTEKDERIAQTLLPFDGKNICIYCADC